MNKHFLKQLTAFLAAAFISTSIFANPWENNLGIGFTVPFSVTGVDESEVDDITQIGFGLNGFYLGHHETGFTAKADTSLGFTTSKDIRLQNHKRNVGFFTDLSFGPGYTFAASDKMTFSIIGMLGLDISIFGDSEDSIDYDHENVDDKKADYERTLALITANLGVDFFAKCKLGEHIGFFSNLAVRYIAGGWGIDRTEFTYISSSTGRKVSDNKKDDTDLTGYFTIQPSFGICWTF